MGRRQSFVSGGEGHSKKYTDRDMDWDKCFVCQEIATEKLRCPINWKGTD